MDRRHRVPPHLGGRRGSGKMTDLMRRALSTALLVAAFAVAAVGLAAAAGAATRTPSAASTTTPPTVATSAAPAGVPTVAPITESTVAAKAAAKKSARTTVNVLIGVLLALAAIVIGVSVWYWRVTKPLPPQLEPLATMSTRSWRRAPPARREASLERVRPKRSLDPLLAPVGARRTVTAANAERIAPNGEHAS